MRVDPGETLAGRPILEIHELMKHHSDFLTREIVEFELDVGPRKAAQIIKLLVKAGHIDAKREMGETVFSATIQGRALAMASASPPVSRVRAEREVKAFLARVREVNGNPEFLVGVDEVRVFGSFARGAPKVGDVDLALRFFRKNAATYPAEAHAQVTEAKRAGRHFATYFDELSWPDDKTKEFLRGESGLLSLHDLQSEKSGPVAEAKMVLFSRSGSSGPGPARRGPKPRKK
jgi:predicted nucleotidyltransferase